MTSPFHNQKPKTKATAVKNGFSSEFIGEQQSLSQPDQNRPQFKIINHRLGGILSLGKTIEFGKASSPEKSLFTPNHLEKEQNLLFSNQQQELKQAIKKLREELAKLIKSTKNLDSQTEKAVLEVVAEPSQYQISFLQRLKNIVIAFRQNISEASVWLDMFNSKKSKKGKKGAFWSKVKSKKGGGEQYLFSSEHSASRSAA